MHTKQWTTVQIQPGYFGKHRNQRLAELEAEYGKDNWRIAWQVPGREENQALDFIGMTVLYEESYYWFLHNQEEVREELLQVAREVYDDEPSNIFSGFDYLCQETIRTHVQDIAIRRVLLRLGATFQGAELLQIRDSKGIHPLSKTLSPGRVPFYQPHLIRGPELAGWWNTGSVESFYQSNKVIQCRA